MIGALLASENIPCLLFENCRKAFVLVKILVSEMDLDDMALWGGKRGDDIKWSLEVILFCHGLITAYCPN